MSVGELIADCNFIMMASSHIYNGNSNDCKVLSNVFGRTVVSCRNFAVNSDLLDGTVSIVEATFDNDSQIVVVSIDRVPVFRYGKRTRFSTHHVYNFLEEKKDWQDDIHFLAECISRGVE